MRTTPVPATIPNISPPPIMIPSLATGDSAGAQNGGNLHPATEAIGEGASGGGGGLLDWALWPLWGTIDALKWAGGTVNEVAVAPVIRLASPWGLAGSILTTVKAYTPQRARDLARIAGNLGLNGAGLVATPAGGQVLRSTGRATSSLSVAISSPAGRQFLVESATGLVKLAEAMDTPEAKNFIRQGAVVAARGMDALASRHTKIFVKDLADVVIRLVELANSNEATKLAAELTVNVAHALEMEHIAGVERKRAAAKTASPYSPDGETGSTPREAFAASVDSDGGAHQLGRRAGGGVDNDVAVLGGTRVAGDPERGPEAAGEEGEQTLDDLVREARLERARQEGYRRESGGICGGKGSGRTEHTRSRPAENPRAVADGNGGRPSDVDVDTDETGTGRGRSTADCPDSNGASGPTETPRESPSTVAGAPGSSSAGETAAMSAPAALHGSPAHGLPRQGRGGTGTGASRSDTAGDGSGSDASNTPSPASGASTTAAAAAAAAPAAIGRSRLGTGCRTADSDGTESVGSGAHPGVEYERDGNARLPRFRPSDFASVLRGQTLGLEMQLEPPNEESLDDTVARASRLAPEGAPCSRSPRGATAGGGAVGGQEAGPETTGGDFFSWGGGEARDGRAVRAGQSTRARVAGGWKQALFAWLLLLLAGDGLRQRWKRASYGRESPARPSSPTLTTAQSEKDSEPGFSVGGSGEGAGQKFVFGAAFLPPTCQDPASGTTMAIWVTPSGPCLSPASTSRRRAGEGARGQSGERDGGGGPACAASFRLCSVTEATVQDSGRGASPEGGEL
ncbi:unnamed protein product [Scytosiphon promiscuus]